MYFWILISKDDLARVQKEDLVKEYCEYHGLDNEPDSFNECIDEVKYCYILYLIEREHLSAEMERELMSFLDNNDITYKRYE